MTTNKIVTLCRECKFSTFDNKEQTGCQFGLLNNYSQAGIELLEGYDEDGTIFKVIPRICMYSRTHNSPHTREEVLEAIKVCYQVIILLANDDIDDFSSCLQSIIDQEIKPRHITVIRPAGINVKPFLYTKLLSKSGIKWRYQDATEGVASELDLIDIAIDAVTYPYYIVLKRGGKLPSSFSNEFNDLVNKQFTIFSYLSSPHVAIVPTIYHKQLGGNSFEPLANKIIQDETLGDILFFAGDVIPCLK